MSKRSKSANNKIGGQFAPRTIEMLRSPAMRILSLTGHRILNRLEIEHADHGGRDNGRLPVTFADLVQYGIANRHLIRPGIRELSALGFVELTRPGRSGNGEHRSPNLFRITYLPANGEAPTNEWRCVQSIEEAKQIAGNARGATRKNRPAARKIPSAENNTDVGAKTTPKTSAENNTGRAFSPVPKTTPLSRHLSIYRPGTRSRTNQGH